ncbi:hypothetical protein [Streptomyces diastatochromogenes]|uniref:hypothetical protein n=1 Tax=Streptomyces diastatochromogenes TaxID=42236 RepID=UPI001FC9C338|nr:hypothetical protein [Streptomyces diastatochromogenes]MCZ0990888.1 hypothetical protein [Streptomyces diastatochromogenes]
MAGSSGDAGRVLLCDDLQGVAELPGDHGLGLDAVPRFAAVVAQGDGDGSDRLVAAPVALPSHWDDYHFVFSATVRWYLIESPGNDPALNPAGLAVEAVLNRARAVTERREPGRASLVQHEFSGVLSRMCPDPTGHLQAMAESISLTFLEQDQERLDRLADVRKGKAVWEHQRKYEQPGKPFAYETAEDLLRRFDPPPTFTPNSWTHAREVVGRFLARIGSDGCAIADPDNARTRLSTSLQPLAATSAPRHATVHNDINGGVQHGPVIQSGRITELTFHVHQPPAPDQS